MPPCRTLCGYEGRSLGEKTRPQLQIVLFKLLTLSTFKSLLPPSNRCSHPTSSFAEISSYKVRSRPVIPGKPGIPPLKNQVLEFLEKSFLCSGNVLDF